VLLINNNAGDSQQHTNLDPLPYTLRYNLGSALSHSSVRYIRVGASDDSTRFPPTLSVRASTTSDFSSGVTVIGSFSTNGFPGTNASKDVAMF